MRVQSFCWRYRQLNHNNNTVRNFEYRYRTAKYIYIILDMYKDIKVYLSLLRHRVLQYRDLTLIMGNYNSLLKYRPITITINIFFYQQVIILSFYLNEGCMKRS